MHTTATALLDTSALPIARVPHFPSTDADCARWLADMEALIAARQRFVLLYDPLPPLDSQQEDAAARKRLVMWLKAHRDGFLQHCRGMVITCAPDLSDKPMLEHMQGPLSKVYGVPVELADTEAAAQARALHLAAS